MNYKKIFLGLIFSGLFFGAFAADKNVEAKISKVTVYLNGAQVKRSGSTSVAAGKSSLIIDNLPSNIDVNSIQASGKGDFTILAVNYKNRDYNSNEYPQSILDLQNEISDLSDSISFNDKI